MKYEKICLIGAGFMGSPILEGAVRSKLYDPKNVLIYDIDTHKAEGLAQKLGAKTAGSVREAIMGADVVLLATKPNKIGEVLGESGDLTDYRMYISIAAGVSTEKMEQCCPGIAVVRAMPNQPITVGEGMTVICGGKNTKDEHIAAAKRIFDCGGKTEIIPESLMNGVVALTSSSPAIVFEMIEAMADEAVNSGFARKQAYDMAAQAVMGAAKMVLETGVHPAELKDRVCSPAGTTIAMVNTLHKSGFHAAVTDSMKSCTDRINEMSGNGGK